MSNVYRDPALSQLAQQLQAEQVKNVLLEEENQKLREMLKVQVASEPDILPAPPSWRQRASCRFLNRHVLTIEVHVPGLHKVLETTYVNGDKLRLTREEFSRHCSIYCQHCGLLHKDFYQSTPMIGLMVWIDLVNLVNQAYNQFVEHYAHANQAG